MPTPTSAAAAHRLGIARQLARQHEAALSALYATVPVFARGNADLEVEETIGYEVGYKAALSDDVYVTVDIYRNNIKNFVTDLLPGVNPTFGAWTAPATCPSPTDASGTTYRRWPPPTSSPA